MLPMLSQGLGFRGLGFRGLGFRGLGFFFFWGLGPLEASACWSSLSMEVSS